MSGQVLEDRFLPMYKHDPTHWSPEAFAALDSFFGDVDDYTPDDALRADTGGIDTEQLRARATITLERLRALVNA